VPLTNGCALILAARSSAAATCMRPPLQALRFHVGRYRARPINQPMPNDSLTSSCLSWSLDNSLKVGDPAAGTLCVSMLFSLYRCHISASKDHLCATILPRPHNSICQRGVCAAQWADYWVPCERCGIWYPCTSCSCSRSWGRGRAWSFPSDLPRQPPILPHVSTPSSL